jgi:hypothetical protein
MSYELEAKKRKFDRILESLTDGASRSTLNTRNNAVQQNLSKSSDSSKRRRITPSSLVSKAASTSSLTAHYLPSSRPAFLERLETYRQVTQWHIPSTEPINAAAWAKRGWICVDKDTVFCGQCKERLTVDLDLDNGNLHEPDATGDGAEDQDYSLAKEVYDALLQRYQEMIVTAHVDSCPWRKRGCDSSIQRMEGLWNIGNAVNGMKERYRSIATNIEELPTIYLTAEMVVNDSELRNCKINDSDTSIDALRLAICGWQRKCTDVVECRNCFRSLGLWLYRGATPTIENLDAIDSHLDYCPWRSQEAQDSQITTTGRDGVQVQTSMAGWQLVYQAILKTNARQPSSTRPTTAVTASSEAAGSLDSQMSPEQREKKMRDLMKRIKDLKKPFNMKALLRKKDKAKPGERPKTAG